VDSRKNMQILLMRRTAAPHTGWSEQGSSVVSFSKPGVVETVQVHGMFGDPEVIRSALTRLVLTGRLAGNDPEALAGH
jgi:hypothetical protein